MQTVCIFLTKCYLAVICAASNRRDIAGMFSEMPRRGLSCYS